ncbi:hypothetical protein [Devosia soli]|nr:hypothetical protein [Devosia soli]
MLFSKRAGQIAWNQFKMPEQLVMLAMTAGPQKDVEWIIQRALCFHNVAEITPRGLKLTRFGRRVMAERHGLPVVVGRETVAAAAETGHLGRSFE